MKVFEALADAVIAEGVDRVFTFLDKTNYQLAQALHEKGASIIHTRHEQGAVYMTDGYATASGKVGVCLVGAGPAFAQTGTGLISARSRQSRVVVLVGDVAGDALGSGKAMNQRGFTEVTSGYFIALRKASTTAEDVQHAFKYAGSGHGPAVLSMPEDVQGQDYPGAFDYRPWASMPRPAPFSPNHEVVERAAAILATCRRPVILAGRGAVTSGARNELESLSARLDALLATTLLAQGMFHGHPKNAGVVGDLATDGALQLLAQADCVLAVGASLNPHTVQGRTLAPRATFIHIDKDPDRFNELTQVDLAIQGDATVTVAELNKLLEAAGISERKSYWSSEPMQAIIQASRRRPPPPPEKPGQALHPGTFFAALDKILPSNLTLVQPGIPGTPRAGAGHFTLPYISIPSAEAMIRVTGFGSVGLGLAMGIGTAMARPDNFCVEIEGDGSFAMNIQELDTAVRYSVPLTIIVMNDSAYGAEAMFLMEGGKPPTIAQVHDVDFAAIARAFGARGVTVRTLADMDAVAAELHTKHGPLVVDVKIRTAESFEA